MSSLSSASATAGGTETAERLLRRCSLNLKSFSDGLSDTKRSVLGLADFHKILKDPKTTFQSFNEDYSVCFVRTGTVLGNFLLQGSTTMELALDLQSVLFLAPAKMNLFWSSMPTLATSYAKRLNAPWLLQATKRYCA